MISAISIEVQAENLFNKSETVIFSCELSNQKSVAVCGGKESKNEYLEYRYGRSSNIEMRYTATVEDKKKKFHRAEVVYASNASDVVWFQKGRFFYLIHLPMGGAPLLDVVRGGRIISHSNCKGGWTAVQSNLNSAKKFVLDHGSGSIDTMAPLWSDE